jgi:hypothetical protein
LRIHASSSSIYSVQRLRLKTVFNLCGSDLWCNNFSIKTCTFFLIWHVAEFSSPCQDWKRCFLFFSISAGDSSTRSPRDEGYERDQDRTTVRSISNGGASTSAASSSTSSTQHQHQHGSTSMTSPTTATSPHSHSVGIVSPGTSSSTKGDRGGKQQQQQQQQQQGGSGTTPANSKSSSGANNGESGNSPGNGSSSGDPSSNSVNPNMPKGTRFNEKTMLLSSDEEFQWRESRVIFYIFNLAIYFCFKT